MKTLNLLLILFCFQSIFSQSKSLLVRQEYLRNHHLFVVNVKLDQKDLAEEQLDTLLSYENAINSNLKISLTNFWDLSDTIIYIDKSELKKYQKTYPEEIFLETILENEYMSVLSFHLTMPKKSNYFNNISPRLIDGDSSLIKIVEDIRLIRYNVIFGDVYYQGGDLEKELLILDETVLNTYHQEFIDNLKKMFPDGYKLVSREFLENALFARDKKYFYAYSLSLINVEDGSLLKL